MLEPRPIRTEADYRAALDEIERLFDAEPNTLECDRLEVLTTLVEAYEQRHYPIEAPEPIEAILYYLESRGLSAHDLEPIIGSLGEVTEILNRQQALTIEMIRRLIEPRMTRSHAIPTSTSPGWMTPGITDSP